SALTIFAVSPSLKAGHSRASGAGGCGMLRPPPDATATGAAAISAPTATAMNARRATGRRGSVFRMAGPMAGQLEAGRRRRPQSGSDIVRPSHILRLMAGRVEPAVDKARVARRTVDANRDLARKHRLDRK